MYKIAHVCIYVKNMKEAVSFYTDILGFEVEGTNKNELMEFTYINAGGLCLELIEKLDGSFKERTAGQIDHVAFMVEDVAAETERLKWLGVKLCFEEPKSTGAFIIMFFEGPNGERIEIMETIGKK